MPNTGSVRLGALRNMLLLETAADDWFHRMSADDQQSYLKEHPGSHYAKSAKSVRTGIPCADNSGRSKLRRGVDPSVHHGEILEKHGFDDEGQDGGVNIYEHAPTSNEVHVHKDGSWEHHVNRGLRRGTEIVGRGKSHETLHDHLSDYYDDDDDGASHTGPVGRPRRRGRR